ncbi:MAG: discoidin domain-containing protein [Candidatus Coatesbacteria bacterium]|nr:MAG: discoidin domain-containing protein [Candidatus Coatesbacteria bacterium]
MAYRMTPIRALALVAVAGAALAFVACRGGQPGEASFRLISDSLGEVPMHPDALKIDNLAQAHDGSMATRWTTFTNMEPGFFVELEFDRPREVAGLVLHTEPSPHDFPREFVVEVSEDGTEWEEAAVGGRKATKKGVTTIAFDRPRKVRHIIVSVNKAAPFWWSIYELEVTYAE